MKKTVCLILALALTFAFVSCGGSGGKDASKETSELSPTEAAFNLSASAYKSLTEASDIVEGFATEISNAWRAGIYEDISDLSDLQDELFILTLSDLRLGMAYYENEDKWDDMTDRERTRYAANEADDDFEWLIILSDSEFSLCVDVVTYTYAATGRTKEAEDLLNKAKNNIKELSEKYPNYEHYATLKDYYGKMSSFLTFCKDPTGSFEQLKVTVEEYKTSIRDYKSSLDYFFEDWSDPDESEETTELSLSGAEL